MIHLLENFIFTAVTLDLVNSIFTPETTCSKIRIERKFLKTFVFTTTWWLEGRKRVLDSLLPAWRTSCSFSCFLFCKRLWEGLSKPTTRHRRERFRCWCDVSMHRSLEWVLDKSRLLGKGISLTNIMPTYCTNLPAIFNSPISNAVTVCFESRNYDGDRVCVTRAIVDKLLSSGLQ